MRRMISACRQVTVTVCQSKKIQGYYNSRNQGFHKGNLWAEHNGQGNQGELREICGENPGKLRDCNFPTFYAFLPPRLTK